MERVQVAVVGAGAAGASAATEAAEAGLSVVLFDENPIEPTMLAMDVPLMFGERYVNTVRNRALMLERYVTSGELLQQAEEAGVDVRLGISVWGSFKNEDHSYQHEFPVLGLADTEHSWMIEYERLILAPGARDFALAVKGWDAAGVMGAGGFLSLARRYQALSSRRLVVLGANDLGMEVAQTAADMGLEVAGIVDVSSDPSGNVATRTKLEARGIPIFLSTTVVEVRTDGDEVTGIVVSGVDGSMTPVGEASTLDCDSVVFAIGQTPMSDIAFITGCQMAFRPELGGWAPEVDHNMETSVPGVYVAGDAAGVGAGVCSDASTAVAQGRIAGTAATQSLGALDRAAADRRVVELTPSGGLDGTEAFDYRQRWFDSLRETGGSDVLVCRCEEVTQGELLNVAPPRYLGWNSEEMTRRNIDTLLKDGPVDQDQVKRLTRAGMGYCQGRRCRDQVSMLLAHSTGTPLAEVPLASYRAPVRPLPLKIIYAHDEAQELRDRWSGWLHMPRNFRRGPVGPHAPGQ
jgi:thioredoxin reductase